MPSSPAAAASTTTITVVVGSLDRDPTRGLITMIGHHYVNEQIATSAGHRLQAEANVRMWHDEDATSSVILRLARALSHAGEARSSPVTVTTPVTDPAS